ncbi:hypothetical protein [Candidatus Lariskella endosymbiont of Hedychridium roseum]|uniref:hypothetical protein n=1 Tax=Candidatus Lariskella endosymbiont of Hedychridium roseum TaxID=3077949 RepID=UPI0030D3A81A
MLKTLRSNGQIPHGLKTQYANKLHETIGDILHNTRYDKESKQLMMSEILSFISYDDMKAILNSACMFCYITEQESVDAIMQSTI